MIHRPQGGQAVRRACATATACSIATGAATATAIFAAAARFALIALVALGAPLAPVPAMAGPTVQLQASASSDLPNDEMVVQLAVERSGAVAGRLNDEVLAALNLALAKAKTVPGVKAYLGAVTTQPDWGPQGRRAGWRVRGVVVLEGKDLGATGALAGELSADLQIAGVAFRLTDAARSREEERLLKEAAAAFNRRAAQVATAFGFTGFDLRKLDVDHSSAHPPRPMAMEMRAATAGSPPTVPTEGGESTVTLTISGSIDLR